MTTNFEPALTQGILFTDSVIREHGTGKCSYIGSFQIYNLPQFPFQVAPFIATFFLTNVGSDVKELGATVRVENPQNNVVLASSAQKITFNQPPTRDMVFEISLPVTGLTFQSAGKYTVVVFVNNEKLGERSLEVRDVRAAAKPA